MSRTRIRSPGMVARSIKSSQRTIRANRQPIESRLDLRVGCLDDRIDEVDGSVI